MLVVSGRAQEAPCFQPDPIKYDEFTTIDPPSLTNHLRDLHTVLEEQPPKAAVIAYVYGGRQESVNEIPQLVTRVEEGIRLRSGPADRKVYVSNGGYRAKTTVEILIKPYACTTFPSSSSDLRPDEVEFKEFPTATNVRLNSQRIYSLIKTSSLANCMPAARAVRACSGDTQVTVFMIVDEKGIARFVEAVNVHPLNRRAAEENARSWLFDTLVVDGKTSAFSGYVTVRFAAPSEEIDY
jgi:hypothetical protein